MPDSPTALSRPYRYDTCACGNRKAKKSKVCQVCDLAEKRAIQPTDRFRPKPPRPSPKFKSNAETNKLLDEARWKIACDVSRRLEKIENLTADQLRKHAETIKVCGHRSADPGAVADVNREVKFVAYWDTTEAKA